MAEDININEIEEIDEETFDTVTLDFDDAPSQECAVLAVFDAGDNEYIALVPIDAEGEFASEEVYLYRFIEDSEGNPELENIEDDDEFELASDAFDELMDQWEFEEME